MGRRKARAGTSPQTRERLDISAKNVVRFKAERELKEKVI